jgi:hypothetical protein
MRFLRDNGLTLALLTIFFACLVGMVIAGWQVQNEELFQHGRPPIDIASYFFSNTFQSALFENWESEFLQMSAYVMMTAFLFQRGSAESKDPDEKNPPEAEDPARKMNDPKAPWPVRAGGLWRKIYSYSLGIALALLFVVSFVLHWLASVGAANEEKLLHGEATQTALGYLAEPQLWFESFQNWQSEFLSTAVLVVLSVFLRFRGSPESKPVAAPHEKTEH